MGTDAHWCFFLKRSIALLHMSKEISLVVQGYKTISLYDLEDEITDSQTL